MEPTCIVGIGDIVQDKVSGVVGSVIAINNKNRYRAVVRPEASKHNDPSDENTPRGDFAATDLSLKILVKKI